MNKLGGTTLCAALVLFCVGPRSAWAADEDVRANDDIQKLDPNPAVKRARAFTGWMAFRSDQVHRWLRKARSRRELARARCLDDKLTELHAIERLGRSDERAIEAAVRVNGLTGHHMVRLVHLHDASQARLEDAGRCGKNISRRVPMPTTYHVRAFKPRLPVVTNPETRNR